MNKSAGEVGADVAGEESELAERGGERELVRVWEDCERAVRGFGVETRRRANLRARLNAVMK